MSDGFDSNCSAPIREPQPTLELYTDANMDMCGAHSSRGDFFQRPWSASELASEPHINLLELRAAREGLRHLASSGDIVRLFIDNTTALHYIRKQGGTRSHRLGSEAVTLWKETIDSDISLLAPQWIASSDNVSADFLSRNHIHHWELMLDRDLFRQILEHFQVFPTLDAFASRQTHQLPRYMSWFPDSRAVARDAMIAKWDSVTYLFPPVPLLLKVLQKIRAEGCKAILVCPRWPSSMWWTLATDMLVEPPYSLPHFRSALVNLSGEPFQSYLDPLVALVLSGNSSAIH